ncbi:pyridoxamine 5'-phosphate oxidase family protein [Microlunatus sp. GCM10028923]|uniref:pyridoxamine 5'-phosphate oxidase family protein n=1 Tax=Microlunatus sp. GCM10028923 TaxID=3273400 RepID=UPI0036189CC5
MITDPDVDSLTAEADGRFLLGGAECSALIRTHRLGRLVWTETAGPQVRPVGYRSRLDGTEIMIGGGNLNTRLRAGQLVALQIDDLDLETAVGWSVTAYGRITRGATIGVLAVAVDRHSGTYWTGDGHGD